MSSVAPNGLRVLYLLTDGFGGHGGIATYNRDVLTALAGDPAVAEIVALPRSISRPIEDLPAKITHVAAAAGGGGAYLRALVGALRSGCFDLIYCAHVNLAPFAWLAARLARAPWLLAIYGIDAWAPPARRSAAWACARADHVFSISRVTMERFLAWCPYPPERRSILPNAIHLEAFGPGPRNPALVERYRLGGKRVVMTFGRMDPSERYKGFDEIIELLPSLDQDIVYLLAGDGADRPRLEEKARAFGVADRTRFTGLVAEAEKADTYRLADVFALPSTGEGFGFVLIEALACGVPAIGSKVDGGREALREGMLGTLVDPASPAEIRAAIIEALGRPKGIPAGLDYFTFPAFAGRVNALVAELVGR